MRFGPFVPQGWRLDLVGIEPADQSATEAAIDRSGIELVERVVVPALG